jgi:hypothetical protein
VACRHVGVPLTANKGQLAWFESVGKVFIKFGTTFHIGHLETPAQKTEPTVIWYN